MAPFNAQTTEHLDSFDTLSYDTSAIGGLGDEHAQGLFDFDLAWTFDFLDTNSPCHVELPAQQIDTVTATQEIDDTNNWSGAIPHDGVPQPPLTDEHNPTSTLDDDEVNEMLKTWSDASLRPLTINDDLRSMLLDIVAMNSPDDCPHRAFPSCRSLQYFLLLYIRRVHPRFPAMHIPTFSTAKTPAIVLMAMMLAGSCHSVSNGDRFCREYLDRCRYWLTATREKDLKTVGTFALQPESQLILCSAR
jgi:hypothetical protein